MPAINQIRRRLSELRMSREDLARRSGVSVSTLRRIFEDPDRVSLGQLRALAKAVGLIFEEGSLFRGSPPASKFKKDAATEKARRLAEKLQGTSSLEAQGLSRKQFSQMLQQNLHELMAGSPRRIWAT